MSKNMSYMPLNFKNFPNDEFCWSSPDYPLTTPSFFCASGRAKALVGL